MACCHDADRYPMASHRCESSSYFSDPAARATTLDRALILYIVGKRTAVGSLGARLGCLALVPLAIVATYCWWFSFVPRPVHPHFYDRRPVDVYAMVNIFVGLLAWAMFAVLEPLLMGLGVRLERRRNRLRPQGEPVAPQAF